MRHLLFVLESCNELGIYYHRKRDTIHLHVFSEDCSVNSHILTCKQQYDNYLQIFGSQSSEFSRKTQIFCWKFVLRYRFIWLITTNWIIEILPWLSFWNHKYNVTTELHKMTQTFYRRPFILVTWCSCRATPVSVQSET